MTDKEKAKAYDEALDRMKYVVVVPKDKEALQALKETIFPELAESEDEKIRKEINTLYSDIDTCISELLKARTDKDSEAEGKALFKMEGLMVGTLQDLSCIEAYLEKQKEPIDPFDTKLFQDGVKEGRRLEREDIKKEPIPIPDKFSGLKSLLLQYLQSATNRTNDTEIESDTDLFGQKILDYVWKYSEKQEEQKQAEYLDLDNASQDYVYNHFCQGADFTPDYIKGLMEDAFIDGANWQKEQKPAEWSEEDREEDLRMRFAFYTYKNEEDDGVLYLSNVFVEEASRNKGFGTKILAAAEKVAETLGVIQIRLKVKQNSPANACYRKHGYGYMTFEDGYDWLEKTLEYMKPIKQEWSEEDENYYDTIVRKLEVIGDDSGLSNNQIKFLREHCPSHRSEWSEEDERILKGIIGLIDHDQHYGVSNNEMISWLKNRRPSKDCSSCAKHLEGYISGRNDAENKLLEQFGALVTPEDELCIKPRWKPSEEQMEALSDAYVEASTFKKGDILESLYNDLKKL